MILGALVMGRAYAEARFTETVQFYTVSKTFNETTLAEVEVETNVGAAVSGRIKSGQAQGRDVEAANQFPVLQRLEVHVATGSVDAPVGAHVRVTASTADAMLVGTVYRVSERPQAGQTTAWRYPVERLS